MDNIILPTRYSLVGGSGDGPMALTAFDRALLAARVGNFNLVRVTSILPPGARHGEITELKPGMVVHAAMASMTSDVAGELVSAAVAVGLPAESGALGVLMEGAFKGSAPEAEERVRAMASQALGDRGLKPLRIESLSVERRAEKIGCVVAAVVLW